MGGELVLVSACLTVTPLITDGPEHTHTTQKQLMEEASSQQLLKALGERRVEITFNSKPNPLHLPPANILGFFGKIKHQNFSPAAANETSYALKLFLKLGK